MKLMKNIISVPLSQKSAILNSDVTCAYLFQKDDVFTIDFVLNIYTFTQ